MVARAIVSNVARVVEKGGGGIFRLNSDLFLPFSVLVATVVDDIFLGRFE
jgi:hypothetical protein